MLGSLVDEQPEPMTREDFLAMQQRLRSAWSGHLTLHKRDVERVEHVLEPLAADLRHT